MLRLVLPQDLSAASRNVGKKYLFKRIFWIVVVIAILALYEKSAIILIVGYYAFDVGGMTYTGQGYGSWKRANRERQTICYDPNSPVSSEETAADSN